MAIRRNLAFVVFSGVLLVGGHLLGRVLPRAEEPLPTLDAVPTAATPPPRFADLQPDERTAAEILTRSESASPLEFPALLEAAFALDGTDDTTLRSFIVGLLVSRWAKRDAPGALEWLSANAPEANWQKDGALYTLFNAWGARDPVAAIEAGQHIGFDRTLDAVFSATARRDPETFLELVDTFGKEWNRDTSMTRGLFQQTFEEIGRRDPGALAKWLDDGTPPHLAHAAARALGTILAESRGAESYEALAAITAPALRALATDRALDLLSRTNLPAAEAFLEAATADRQATPAIIGTVLRAKSFDDPLAAARWFGAFLAHHPGSLRDQNAVRDVMSGFYQTLPADAALLRRFATEVGPLLPEFSINNLLASAGSLTRAEPRHRADLARELLNLPQDSVRDEMLATLIGHWAGEDNGAALAFSTAISDEPLRRAAQIQVLESWTLAPEKILELAATVGWKGALPTKALEDLAAKYPDQALAHIATLEASDARRAAPTVANVLARHDPEAGRAWIESLSDEETRVRAATGYAAALSYDPGALAAWAADMPPGPMRDGVVRILSLHITDSDPESAFSWALAIRAEAEREETLRLLVKRWADDDLPAAEQAVLQHTALTDRERVTMLRALANLPPN